MSKEVPYLKNKKAFDDAIMKGGLVAVDFTASWCPPCKMIGPKFEAMALNFDNIDFYKCDVD